MLRRMLRREGRAADLAATLIAARSSGSLSAAGEQVTDESALRLSTVWACVNLIARSVSTMPVDVVRYSDGARVPVDAPQLMRSPAAGMSFSQWTHAVMVSQLLRGNAYGMVAATDAGMRYPTQIELLHPDCVTWKQQGRMWQALVEGKPTDVWPVGPLWHLPAYTTPGVPFGLAPISYGRDAIGAGTAAEKFAGRFFAADGHPSSIIYSERDLTEAQSEAVKESFLNATKGNRRPAVMGSGLKYEAIQISPDESQFLESQRFSVEQVARFFGVAPEMIGAATQGSSLTYANREQRTLDFLAFTLNPWIVRLEEALTALLPRPQVVKLNTNSLLRADTKTRWETYQIANGIKALTVNEIRAFEDWAPLPGGDTIPDDPEPVPGVVVNADTTIAEGAIRADTAPVQVDVDARTTVEDGAINASHNPPEIVAEVASAVAGQMETASAAAAAPMLEMFVERDAAFVDQFAAIAERVRASTEASAEASAAVTEAAERMARPRRVVKTVHTDEVGRIQQVVEETE